MIAIVEAYKVGLLKPNNWKANILAGLVIGIVALPLAMAFAIASGVKPEQGIYTAIIAGLVVGIFGGTRVQVAGPTGAFVVIISAIVAKHGVMGMQIATIMAGMILLVMGLLRLGTVIKFIPYPVIVGFTAGISVIIFVGQWKAFFGLEIHIPLEMPLYEKVLLLIKKLPYLDIQTTVLSCISLFIVIFSQNPSNKIPSPLLAMVTTTLLLYVIDAPHVATLGSVFGVIPQGLPKFEIPYGHQINFVDLIGPAFTIAFLGAIESLLAAAATDSYVGKKHNSNAELFGQGLANMIAPLWGGFASTGAIARTFTNIRQGGNSPIAAIVHSIVLIVVLLIFTPYIIYVPLSALAAILFVIAYNMSDIPAFMHITQKAHWHEACILYATFLLTIFADLIVGVAAGFAFAIFFFILNLYQINHFKGNFFNNVRKELSMNNVHSLFIEGGIVHDICGPSFVCSGIVHTINGPFFFGVSEKIENAISKNHADPSKKASYVIFCLENVPYMDLTGIETLTKIIRKHNKHGIKVYITKANERVTETLSKSGILKLVCENKTFHSPQ